MPTFVKAQERDMILFAGSYLEPQKQAVKELSKLWGKQVSALIIFDVTDARAKKDAAKDNSATFLTCDYSSDIALQNALKPYANRLIAVTCRSESNIPLFKRLIPHVPYLNTPSELSLDWTTDKIQMRRLLRNYDKKIAPKFMIAHDASEQTLDSIEKKVGFPLIIKPSGLAASLLVSLCYHREELEQNLNNTVKKINKIYKKKKGRGEPQILIEEYMDGTMYSVDSYVNNRGVTYHTPLVHVKTGRTIGFDDFFGYMRIAPVVLRPYKVEAAYQVADKAIEAMGLRSVTCHVELMKTESGWRVIELGPRIGGFRHEIYQLSYGFDHSLNDVLIRVPQRPIIGKKIKGYTAALQFYPKRKGRLLSIDGLNRVKKLESFHRIEVKKVKGDMCNFARNGDDPVFDIVLFNKNRSNLRADIRRLETTIEIKIKKPQRKTTA